MGKRDIERALRKQALQQESQTLRVQWAHYARGVKPAFAAADVAKQGWNWLKQHPAVPLAVVATVVVVKPALALRIGRGAWVGWQAWQRYRQFVGPVGGEPADKSP